jgi:hypothetical protein
MSGTPIFGPNRGFKVWTKDQIYTLDNSSPGLYVPNIGDVVIEWVGNVLQIYKVTGVNNTNGSSTLTPGVLMPPSGGLLEEDILLGSGPGTISESYRLYCNNDTNPATLSFDSRLHIYGSNAHHIKVFRGTDTSENGSVISAVVNFNFSNNTYTIVSENIPLETVIQPGVGVIAVKTPSVGRSIEQLIDGEVCTAVVYDIGGTVVSISKLLVRLTNFVRSTDSSTRYIIGVELLTPFMNSTNNHQVDVPINTLMQSMQFQCLVKYSDGDQSVIPIDGVKVQLLGLDNFIATVLGQTAPLVLVYNMAANEYANTNPSPSADRFITEDYTITTTAVVGAYSVKLFAVPRWQTTPTSQWVLDWYMYTMDREEIFEVTNSITYVTPFNGTLIGSNQTVTVQLNLQNVVHLPAFNYYQHVQTVIVKLQGSGANNAVVSYWQMEYTPGNFLPGEEYGYTRRAVRGGVDGNYTLNIANGFTVGNEEDWLAEFYGKAEALYLPGLEVAPPVPDRVRIRIGASVSEILVVNFHQTITGIALSAAEMAQGKPALLEFFTMDGLNYVELGMASLTIQVP